MITFKVVDFVALTILIFIFLCESCSSIDITQNVRFVKPLSENYNQEQEQNVISPHIYTYVNTLSDIIKDQEIVSAEDGIRWGNERKSLDVLKNKRRIVRQVSNAYSTFYPALPTPYPNVKVNPTQYKPAAPFYGTTPYNNFNTYPASNQNYFPNTTSRYPPYNAVSSRPPYYPPKQNYNNFNTTSFNQNLNQYNQSSYLYPNNLSSQTAQHNHFNNYPASNQNNFPNTTSRYPPYNAISSKPPYYPPKQNLNNFNPTSFNQNLSQYNQSSYLYPNNLSSQTAQHNYFNNHPVSNQNYFPTTTSRYPPYNPVSSRPPHYPPKQNLNNFNPTSFNQNLSQYNQSSYLYPNNNSPYQNSPGSTRNISNFNIPSREPWSNNPVPWNPNNQSSSSFYNPGNGLTSNGFQSSPGYSINNGSYTQRSPYFSRSNSTSRPDFYDSFKYNNPPNQNNYREPNHFFYTPGQNPPSYDTSKFYPEKFS